MYLINRLAEQLGLEVVHTKHDRFIVSEIVDPDGPAMETLEELDTFEATQAWLKGYEKGAKAAADEG